MNGIPEAVDEYDSYAMKVFGLLHKGSGAPEIRAYLEWVVSERIELTPDTAVSDVVSTKAVELHRLHVADKG